MMIRTTSSDPHVSCGPVRIKRLPGLASRRQPETRRGHSTQSKPLDSGDSAAPLTKDDLIAFFQSSCKPAADWRIGTEQEKLAFNVNDCSRVTFFQVEELLGQLVARHGWQPVSEDGRLIAAQRGQASVTLEPGGQLELSGAPQPNLHAFHAELSNHIAEVTSIGREMGVEILGLGLDPLSREDPAEGGVSTMPKATFRVFAKHYAADKPREQLMYLTCTTQVNLDYGSEADAVAKMRVGLALQPLATGLFAASPFKEGAPSGYLSTRWHVYNSIQPQERVTNVPGHPFDPGFGFERYTDWALDVPMLYVLRHGRVHDTVGASFRDFMQGRLQALPGQYAGVKDWANHLGTLYPDCRLKRIIEMRGADSGPWRMVPALPALWVGLLYDQRALGQALELVNDWTQAERDYLRHQVPITGLATPFRPRTWRRVSRLANAMLDIAEGGLRRRGLGEEVFLQELRLIADSGLTPADHLLELYHGRWQGDVRHVLNELHFT